MPFGPPLNLPNLLSLLRMGLVPLFIIAITRGEVGRALALFALAGVTDALDGFVARFWNQQTLLGTYLDPIGDKLLLTSAYVVLSIPALNPQMVIPLWVTILVIARDVLIVVIAISLYLALGIRRFPPTWISKLTTVAQVAAIALILAFLTWPATAWLQTSAEASILAVALLTVASGLTYAFLAARLAGRERGAD